MGFCFAECSCGLVLELVSFAKLIFGDYSQSPLRDLYRRKVSAGFA